MPHVHSGPQWWTRGFEISGVWFQWLSLEVGFLTGVAFCAVVVGAVMAVRRRAGRGSTANDAHQRLLDRARR